MLTGSRFRPVVKDAIIVAVGVAIIWGSLMAVFGTQNPFYVVSSGSMIPALQVYDIIVVQGNDPFEEVEVGDIIVFDRPSDRSRVIVHRVAAITDEDPYTVRTQGDANPAPIPGTDFPVTAKEYIGTVVYSVPHVGFVTRIFAYQIGGVPLNYILIVIIVGAVVARQVLGKPKPKDSEYEGMLSGARAHLSESGIDDRFVLEYSRRGAAVPAVDRGWPRAAEMEKAAGSGRWHEYDRMYEEYVAEKLPARLSEVRAHRAAAHAYNEHVRAMVARGAPAYAFVSPEQLSGMVASGAGPARVTFDARRKERGKIRITLDSSRIAGAARLRPQIARCAPAAHGGSGALQEAEVEGDARAALSRIESGGLPLPEAVREFAEANGVAAE